MKLYVSIQVSMGLRVLCLQVCSDTKPVTAFQKKSVET